MLMYLAAAAPQAENPYGLMEALEQGGTIAWTVFIILCAMSVGTFYILFTKLIEQQKVISQGKKVRATFWRSASLREASAKLEKNSAYKQIVDDGIKAQEEHGKLKDPVEAHDWLHGSLARSEAAINSSLNGGLAFLATVGSTSIISTGTAIPTMATRPAADRCRPAVITHRAVVEAEHSGSSTVRHPRQKLGSWATKRYTL